MAYFDDYTLKLDEHQCTVQPYVISDESKTVSRKKQK